MVRRTFYIVTAVPPGKRSRDLIMMPASKSHAKYVKDGMVDDNRIAISRYRWGNPRIRKATKSNIEAHGTRKGAFTGKRYKQKHKPRQARRRRR